MIKVSEDILFYSFRYALGRSTYAVSDVVEAITENWEDLSDKFKQQVKSEIRKAEMMKQAGMPMDSSEWQKVLKL